MPLLPTIPAQTATVRRHHIAWHTLPAPIQALITDALTQLGSQGGVIEDIPPVIDAAVRTTISNLAAHAAGLTLTPGHEINQCLDCRDLIDGYHANGNGITRCDDCHVTHQLDPDYTN